MFCHRRFSSNDPKIRFGLPESTLGLLPGAGSVVRSVRLLLLERALPLLLEGKTFTPEKALEMGLIDGIFDEGEEPFTAAHQWIAAHPQSQQEFDRKD